MPTLKLTHSRGSYARRLVVSKARLYSDQVGPSSDAAGLVISLFGAPEVPEGRPSIEALLSPREARKLSEQLLGLVDHVDDTLDQVEASDDQVEPAPEAKPPKLSRRQADQLLVNEAVQRAKRVNFNNDFAHGLPALRASSRNRPPGSF